MTRSPSISGDSLIGCAKLPEDVLAPDRRPIAQPQTGQITVLGQHIDAVIIDRWRRPWTIAPAFADFWAEGRAPEDAAILAAQTEDDTCAAVGTLEENPISLDRQ
jgi:hypothetical protein